MARPRLLLGWQLVDLPTTGPGVAALRGWSDHHGLYTLVQVEAGLALQPERWLGQTVRLRAIAEPCAL